jgi:hypothetical protein
MLADGIGAAAKKDFGTSRWQLWYQATRLALCAEGQRSTRAGSAPTISTPGEMTQHDPCRASRLARRTGGDDELDGLFEFGDPLFALRERLSASVRFRAVTGRPSRQLLQLGFAMTGLMRRNTRHVLVAMIYSITSSARASNLSGIVSPSAFAVPRLITSSNLVGCSTGRSAGRAPWRIRLT